MKDEKHLLSTDKMTHFVIVDDAFRNGFIQHFLIPLLQSFGLGNLLVYGVAMEDIIIPFTGWTCPDVTCRVPDRRAERLHSLEKHFYCK